MNFLKKLKTYALFIAMMTGIIFHNIFAPVAFTTKYMLFCMLLITYCKVSPKELKFEKLHLILSAIQLTGCIAVYLLLLMIDKHLAEGSMICILTPTATSAPVITGLLGGSVACLATYSISSNLAIAVIAPIILSMIGAHGHTTEEISFIQAFMTICSKVMPLLIGPCILALILSKTATNIHNTLKTKQIFSFWLWVIALALLMGKTTEDIIALDAENKINAATIALGSLACCIAQFWIGRRVGRTQNNTVAGGQALGQKNTILAIWIAQTFFEPIVAIAPASYVLWQNLINSYQLWRYQKKENKQ